MQVGDVDTADKRAQCAAEAVRCEELPVIGEMVREIAQNPHVEGSRTRVRRLGRPGARGWSAPAAGKRFCSLAAISASEPRRSKSICLPVVSSKMSTEVPGCAWSYALSESATRR